MAQSSSYKTYDRQPRTLTEETAFAGGMLWADNNIDPMHLKSIVNFNYDETTGYLKTRGALLPIPWYGTNPDEEESKKEITIPDLSEADVLIGAYSISPTRILATSDNKEASRTVEAAGWLYLFGVPNYTGDTDSYSEVTLKWVFLDALGDYQNTLLTKFDPFKDNITLLNKHPILYDNSLYFNVQIDEEDIQTAFVRYSLFIIPERDTSTVTGLRDQYYVDRQRYNEAFNPDKPLTGEWVDEQGDKHPNQTTFFETSYKTLVDGTTLLEAMSTGFNALKGFEYTGNPNASLKHIAGVYLTDEQNNICVTPRIGQQTTLHFVLDKIPTTEKGKLSLYKLAQGTTADANAIWSLVMTQDVADKNEYKYIFSDEVTTFRLNWDNGKPKEGYQLYDSLVFTYSSSKINVPLKIKNYAINTAKHSCMWNGHLVLWDVENSSNTLFISEVDNFYYFPVPNNVVVFDTTVISCIPYLNGLTVFTADKVYRLIETKEGSFTQEVVQNNMPISKEDADYIRAIKNMIFFRSGKYYYMLVPKSQSLTGELTVAPIYKNLSKWFDDPIVAVTEMLESIYPENLYSVLDPDHKPIDNPITISEPVDIYVEQDTVTITHNVQAHYTTVKDSMMTAAATQEFLLFINYNTNLRAWTMYLEDTTHTKLFPATLTASRVMSFMRMQLVTDTTQGANIQLVTMQDTNDIDKGVRCLIDTGYRLLANSYKKRFREMQVKLCSTTENITVFGSAFLVDGSLRRSYSHLEEVYSTDSTLYKEMAPVYDPNTFITEVSNTINTEGNPYVYGSRLGSDKIELSDWKLDFSHFKRNAPTTIRIPVSGKGYAPRFIFMTTKGTGLTINTINWVYRMLSGR